MNDDQLLRYSRQIMLPDMDVEGQEKLLAGHAAIVGLGGLGSPAALYLAGAGIGQLTLVDFDDVDVSNLQRQIVHRQASIGQAKVDSAKETLLALNPELHVNTVRKVLDEAGLLQLARSVDVILDATDNFLVRQMLNDACIAARTPWVSAAAIRFEAQITTFDPRRADSPCYRCLYPDTDGTDQTCSENGVISPLVGVLGAFEALEVIKLMTGVGETLVGRIQYFDAKYSEWREFKLRRVANCPACGG